jgi:beta-phosphoglucomutase-like phosphatase (HAD superfamily)
VPAVVDAVIFDLDGLLLESEQVWNAAKEELTRERGGRWTAAAERAMLGMSSPEWSRYMHDELAVPLEPPVISGEVVRLVMQRYRRELPLLDGANEAVSRLAERWRLGLA